MPTSHPHRLTTPLLAVVAVLLAGCPEDSGPLPLGGVCGSDSQCEAGLCLSSRCLDPSGDDDGDQLLNATEGALGTDPFNADSDGDGVSDGVEAGSVDAPSDSDGDGRNDAVESAVSDADSDCIPDQLDPDDQIPETDPATLGAKVCLKRGVCGGGAAAITATCALVNGSPLFSCDYSGVSAYEAEESLCDGLDNDCDGDTDEPFAAAGGGVVFDGGPWSDDAGKALGATCGTGDCSGGVVICDPDQPRALTCSTLGAARAESCEAGDNDCDGRTDEGGPDLPGCVDFFVDVDGDDWGGLDSACLCAAAAPYLASVGGDCDDTDGAYHPGAAGICGQDSDCDGDPVDVGEACDLPGADPLSGCDSCQVVPWAIELGSALGYINTLALAPAGAGGYAALWPYSDQNGTGFEGALVVGAQATPLSHALPQASFINDVALGSLSGGGLVALWDDYMGTSSLSAQRFTATGLVTGGVIAVSDQDGGVNGYGVAGLGADRFAVAWGHQGPSVVLSEMVVSVRLFNAEGKPEGASSIVSSSAWTDRPKIAALGGGASVVMWFESDQQSYLSGLVFRRVDSDGVPQGAPTSLALTGGEDVRAFDLAGLPGGAFMVAVVTQQEGGTDRILFAQRFGADDSPGERLLIEDDSSKIVSWDVAAAASTEGAFLVSWGQSGEVGVPVSAWLLPAPGVTPVTLQLQDMAQISDTSSVVAAGGEGWLGVAFVGTPAGQDAARVFVQRFTPEGTLLFR